MRSGSCATRRLLAARARDTAHPVADSVLRGTFYALARQRHFLAIWRSVDIGRLWQRLNGRRHVYGQRLSCVTGDPRIFGRVYVGTNGRGIIYGDPRRPRAPRTLR